jgi:hypothetical protein
VKFGGAGEGGGGGNWRRIWVHGQHLEVDFNLTMMAIAFGDQLLIAWCLSEPPLKIGVDSPISSLSEAKILLQIVKISSQIFKYKIVLL